MDLWWVGGWLVGFLIDWLIGWLIDWFIDWLICLPGPEGGGSVPLMSQFLEMLELELKKNTNFEAVQAHLGLFIKVILRLFFFLFFLKPYCSFFWNKSERIFEEKKNDLPNSMRKL